MNIGKTFLWFLLLPSIAAGQTNWVRQSPPPAFNSVVQLDEHIAIAVGERTDWWYGGSKGIVFRTSDGGHTWVTVHSINNGILTDVTFSDSLTGFAVGTGFALRTTDAGMTWTEISVGTSNSLTAVHFSSPTHGAIVGEGTFLRSTDGGTSWANLSHGTTNTLRACDFADSTTATAVGARGTILRTTDAGITWNNQHGGINGDIRDVMHTGRDVISAVGALEDPAHWDVRYGTYLRSIDSGHTWNSHLTGFTNDLNALHFLNADTGIVVGDGTILKTTDGGTTWVDKSGGTIRHLRAFRFADAMMGWAVGERGTILHTTDGGLTWRNQASATGVELRAITCLDAMHATAFGSGWDARLGTDVTVSLQTTDGGHTWTSSGQLEGFNLSQATFVDGLTGFAVGTVARQGRGGILRSTDGGSHWSVLLEDPHAYQIGGIAFCDAAHGVAVGYGSDSTDSQWGAIVYTTSNGGASWQRRFMIANASLSDAVVNGPSRFVLVGSANDSLGTSHPLILRSSNAGLDWISHTVAFVGSFNNVAFADTSTGVAFGSTVDGSGNWTNWQFRSTNGGTTWTSIAFTSTQMNDVAFSSPPIGGLAVGNDGIMFRSTDLGSTWAAVARPVPGLLNDIDLVNASTGFAVGSSSGTAFMVRTTDGGSSWTRITALWRATLLSVHTISADEALVIAHRYDQATSSDLSGIVRMTRSGDVISWTTLATRPQMYLHKLIVMDANVWMAVGYRRDVNWNPVSTVLRTTNGGGTWVEISGGTPTELFGASFADPRHGIAVGNGGTVMRSTDGGASWSLASKVITGALYDVAFRDEMNGIAVGERIAPNVSGQAMILRTVNGGGAWTPDSTRFSGRLNSISLNDSQHVVAVGYEDSAYERRGVVLTSVDAGLSWMKRQLPPSRELSSVVFSGDLGLIVGVQPGLDWYNDWIIFRTTNLGITWETQSPQAISQGFYFGERFLTAVSLYQGKVGSLVGRGNNWSTYESAGMIFGTTDAGATWTSQAGTNLDLLDVSFRDAQTGLATGYEGSILRTSNGGLSWEGITNGIRTTLHNVSWMDSLTVMAVGDGGAILRSQDAGMTWTVDSSSCRQTLHDATSASDGFGVAVGDSGTVIVTTDGGLTWSGRVLDLTATLRAAAIVGRQTVFAVGSFDSASSARAVLYRSTNAGSTWDRLVVDTLDGLKTLAFFDDQIGISMTARRSQLRTTDGGATWTTHDVQNGWGSSINDLTIAGPRTAYVVGAQRWGFSHGYTAYLIMRTTDAGLSWEVLQDQVPGGLEGVSFTDANTGTAVGWGGVILRTTNGGTSWVKEGPKVTNAIPRQTGLEQNYPNPFNPETRIGYRIQERGWVKLAVYDLLGREVAVLVDEEKAAGMYEVVFGRPSTVDRLATGIYFCRLTVGGYVETKKMLLLK